MCRWPRTGSSDSAFRPLPHARGRPGYLLDVQSNLLDRLETRVLVLLLVEMQAPPPMATLNPVFEIHGQRHVMVTQSIATLRRKDLGKVVLSLDDQHQQITNAL